MTKIKNHDFIEVEYTGRTKEDNIIFDTSDEKIAKESGIYSEKMRYGPIIICVGECHLLAGLDDQLIGKEAEKGYAIELNAENAFGKKNAKLIQLINTSKFKQQNIVPVPGLQINVDGHIGTIKTVSGGRTLVDFNHPLAGKDIIYDIKINQIITDDKKKIEGYVKLQLSTDEVKVEVEGENAKIILKQELPKEVQEVMNLKLIELIPSIKKIEYLTSKEEKKEILSKEKKEKPKKESKKDKEVNE